MNYRKLAPGLKEFVRFNNISIIVQDNVEYLVLYKAVRADYGSWNKSKKNKDTRGAYRPGNEVHCYRYSTNRSLSCDEGLHVGTFGFARGFIDRSKPIMIEVFVKPEDVVCVPYGYGVGKIRCKKLLVNRTIVKLAHDYWGYETWKKRVGEKWRKSQIDRCDIVALHPFKHVEI